MNDGSPGWLELAHALPLVVLIVAGRPLSAMANGVNSPPRPSARNAEAVLSVAQDRAGLPDLEIGALASGPYSRMYMLYERTIFRVDVLTVEIRVGDESRHTLQSLVGRAGGANRLADEIAATVMDAQQVLVTIEFQRNVSFDRWLEGVRENLGHARDSDIIDERTYDRVSKGLPEWFRTVTERGFRTRDRIVYRGYPDRMRTLLVSAAGEIFVDQVDTGAGPRRTMLAGYLAPGTDFRGPLVKSLLAR